MRGVVPGPQRAPLAGRLALAAGQVDDHLVLRQRGGDVEHVDQQPLAVAIDGLGPRRAGARAMTRAGRPPWSWAGRRLRRGDPEATAVPSPGPAGSSSRSRSAARRGLPDPGRCPCGLAPRRRARPGAAVPGRPSPGPNSTAERRLPVAVQPQLAPGLRQLGRRRAGAGSRRPTAAGTTGGDCNRPRELGQQQRRPEVLARLPLRAEIRAGARGQQLRAPQPEPHPVLRRPAHPGHDLAGPGRHQGDPALDKIRLAPRPDRVVEIPRDFLGNPHHLFPLGTDPAISVASRLSRGGPAQRHPPNRKALREWVALGYPRPRAGRRPPPTSEDPRWCRRKARWEDKQPAHSAEAARAGVRPVKPALRCDRENPRLRPEKKTLRLH